MALKGRSKFWKNKQKISTTKIPELCIACSVYGSTGGK